MSEFGWIMLFKYYTKAFQEENPQKKEALFKFIMRLQREVIQSGM